MITGQKVKLSDIMDHHQCSIEISGNISCDLDITCFGLDENRYLSDDRYMIFYNQKNSPEYGITMQDNTVTNTERFNIDLDKLPESIKYLVFTVSIDGNLTMDDLSNIECILKDNEAEKAKYSLTGSDFASEKAIVLFELYYKDMWRLNAVGKGFNGGLEALLVDFGGEAETSETTSLQEGEVLAEQVNSSKKEFMKIARDAIGQTGLLGHKCRIVLCLDISVSMSGAYKSGEVQNFMEQMIAFNAGFSNTEQMDVFLFGEEAYKVENDSMEEDSDYIAKLIEQYPLEWGTYYHKAIHQIRAYYSLESKLENKLPVHVVFLTDGDTTKQEDCKKELELTSAQSIFWNFIGIGTCKFTFMEKNIIKEQKSLINTSFKKYPCIEVIDEAQLYNELLKNYKIWVKEVDKIV